MKNKNLFVSMQSQEVSKLDITTDEPNIRIIVGYYQLQERF
jgi:hypothetical protein